MYIVATSDTHFAGVDYKYSVNVDIIGKIKAAVEPLKKVTEPKVLVHAGDLSLAGTAGEWKQRLRWMADISWYFDKCFFTPGNHDIHVEKRRALCIKDLLKCGSGSWELLTGHCRYKDVKFYGTPWTCNLPRWAFQKTEEEVLEEFQFLKATPSQPQVLVSHSPPRNHLDGHHYGTLGLEEYIEKEQPPLVICGHVHEGYGTKKIGNTLVANVSMCDSDYRVVNNPMGFYLAGDTVERIY